jgi:hypothetical protein
LVGRKKIEEAFEEFGANQNETVEVVWIEGEVS